jgi:hypothetical protein
LSAVNSSGAEELEPIEPETPLRHGHHRLKIKQGESLFQKIANEIIVRHKHHRHHRLFMKKVKKMERGRKSRGHFRLRIYFVNFCGFEPESLCRTKNSIKSY